MHQAQLVFARLMRHLALTTFRRCMARYATLSIGDWFTNCCLIHATSWPECYDKNHSI
jgi:hypothetical protein